jgi:acyl homoserine lactone synthase
MARILTNADRDAYPDLFDQMFRARAEVFHKRLRWNVVVRNGWEIDRYDENEDPVYLVTIEGSRTISGSLRLLPTTGPTMLSNEFANFFDEPIDVESPTAWECTRFCIHPFNPGCETRRQISTRLLIGLCELCLLSGVEQIVAVYENCMSRVYGRIGWVPTVLATACRGNLTVGIWDVSEQALNDMRNRLDRLQSTGKVLAA